MDITVAAGHRRLGPDTRVWKDSFNYVKDQKKDIWHMILHGYHCDPDV